MEFTGRIEKIELLKAKKTNDEYVKIKLSNAQQPFSSWEPEECKDLKVGDLINFTYIPKGKYNNIQSGSINIIVANPEEQTVLEKPKRIVPQKDIHLTPESVRIASLNIASQREPNETAFEVLAKKYERFINTGEFE